MIAQRNANRMKMNSSSVISTAAYVTYQMVAPRARRVYCAFCKRRSEGGSEKINKRDAAMLPDTEQQGTEARPDGTHWSNEMSPSYKFAAPR